MRVTVYHPRLTSSTMPALTPDAWEYWDGGLLSFSIKASLWQGLNISTHLMRVNNTYLKYFPEIERKKLSKYAGDLKQHIDSASEVTDAYYIQSAREQLEQFKTETQ